MSFTVLVVKVKLGINIFHVWFFVKPCFDIFCISLLHQRKNASLLDDSERIACEFHNSINSISHDSGGNQVVLYFALCSHSFFAVSAACLVVYFCSQHLPLRNFQTKAKSFFLPPFLGLDAFSGNSGSGFLRWYFMF